MYLKEKLKRRGLAGPFLVLCFLVGAGIGFLKWREAVTDGFSPNQIYSFEDEEHIFSEKEVPSFLHSFFSQQFSYLGKGAQSYVFASEDGQYVLKLFKKKHFTTHRWVDALPFFEEHKKKREQRRKALLESFALAKEKLKKGGGLLFCRVSPGGEWEKEVSLKGKEGTFFQVNLADVPFVIQKKGVPYYAYISSLMLEGNQEKARQALNKVIALKQMLAEKKIWDQDHAFGQNYGFDKDGEPFLIDLGRLKERKDLSSDAIFQYEMEKIVIEKPNAAYEARYPKVQEFYRLFIAS